MDCGNQPVFTALEEGKDERYLANKPHGSDGGGWNHGTYSFEEDLMSLPFISMGYDQFPGRDIQNDGYSYTPDLNFIPGPMVDKNWINIKSDMSEPCTDYEMLPPELSMRGDGADFQMSPAVNSLDYGKSEIPTNCSPPTCETRTGYPIKIHGAEAKNSRTSRFQMSGQFSSSGCNTSLLPLVDNFGARGSKHDINNVPLSSSSPQNVDRNYLTLGIGGGTKFRPNSNFSTREISNKLEEVSSQCNNPIMGPCPKNITSLTQVAGGDARSQTHTGGSSRPYSNFSTRRIPSKSQEVSSPFNNSSIGHYSKNPLNLNQMSCGDARIQTKAGGGLSISNSNFSAQEIANKLEGVSFNSNNSIAGHYPKNPLNLNQLAGGAGELPRSPCNLASRMPTCVEGGLIGGTGFRQNSNPFPGLHTLQTNMPSNTPSKCYTSVSQPTPISLPSGSTLFSQTNCGSQPEVTSTYFDSPPISWQQGYSRKSSMNVLSESSRNYLSHRHKQSPTGHVQPGNLRSAAEVMRTEGDLIGYFPSSVQPVGQFDAFHNPSPIEAPRNFISPGVQFPRSSTNQSAAAGCFPKRLGLQTNDFAIARNIRGQYQHGMSTQSSAVFPRVDNSSGQVVPVDKLNIRPQVAPNISRPPLKRKAVANPSALPVQRRKVLPQPVISDSTLQRRLSIPTIPAPIPAATHIPPAAPLHVKWKGFEEALEPMGKSCLLCKRDLSFTAEGLMYQPTAPPPVAVLPCGHTFHDQCLQIITPRDQSKDPPCIPCAVGET